MRPESNITAVRHRFRKNPRRAARPAQAGSYVELAQRSGVMLAVQPLLFPEDCVDIFAQRTFYLRLFVLFACYFVGLLAATVALGNDPDRITVKLKTGKSTYVGHPLVEASNVTVLLRRNGRLKIIEADKIDSLVEVAKTFKPKTGRQLRAELQKEFGSQYEVSMTNHFVIVHPPGAYQRWGLPFEQFYLRFRAWFAARGMNLEQPEFPMVAIVLRTRGEYDRFVARKPAFGFQTAGYYSPSSNRMITYDIDSGPTRLATASSFETNSTVAHEAVHQTAYNTGIHHRYQGQPQWFKEGLATIFEAPGVNNPVEHPRPSDRINREYLSTLQSLLEQNPSKPLVEYLISSDNYFRLDADQAYALSWGLTSYLTESYPRQYIGYIKLLQDNPATNSQDTATRIKYFEQAFGQASKIDGGLRTYAKNLDR